MRLVIAGATGLLVVSLGAGAAPVTRAVPDSSRIPGALPASSAAHLPSTAEQFRALQAEIARSRPAVEDARRQSDALSAQVRDLKHRLIDTAARVQGLEAAKYTIDAEVRRLVQAETGMKETLIQQRERVTALLAGVERLQHDVPPILAIRGGDALAAAHASMLLGAALPRLYAATAELSHQLAALRQTQADLVRKRSDALRDANALVIARSELDQLLAMKSKEAAEADARFDDLAAKLGASTREAADLDALLRRVAALRLPAPPQGVVTVDSRSTNANRDLVQLLPPVVGRFERGDGAPKGAFRDPGISFLAPPSAQVVAPADSRVLFAGPYHKTGEVLILQTSNGYDLVLAGLDRVDVRAGNRLLAGEPVGRMPRTGPETRLYFELRHDGKGINPVPWLELGPRKVSRS